MRIEDLPEHTKDWGAEWAQPVSTLTARHARLLSDALPPRFRPGHPGVSADRDGGILFSWSSDRGSALMCVSESAWSFWALLDGKGARRVKSGYANPPGAASVAAVVAALEELNYQP